jgi:acyl carrier protein
MLQLRQSNGTRPRGSMSIKDDIRRFVASTFLLDEAAPVDDDQSFLDSGIIDSTGVLHLVMFLQTHFGLEISDEELVPEHLDSVNQVAEFVRQKLNRE